MGTGAELQAMAISRRILGAPNCQFPALGIS